MSKLREKSEFNIEAAILLVDNNLYAPSVHCSYYSCVQLMKYIINDFFKIDYSDMASQISQSKSGTHVFLINYIHDNLRTYMGNERARNFKRSIKDYKTVYSIYANTWAKYKYEFSKQDSLTLWEIAKSDPLVSGRAVSVAKYMLGISFVNNINSISNENEATDEPIIETDNSINNIKVYPNPTENDIEFEIINYNNENYILEIYNTVGKLIYTKSLNKRVNSINISDFDKGVYVYKVYNDKQRIGFGKFIKM